MDAPVGKNSGDERDHPGAEASAPSRGNVILVLIAAISEADPAGRAWLRCLSPDEVARSRRFRRSEDRARFVLGRVLLRTVLADMTGMAPAEIVLRMNPWGKPEPRAGPGGARPVHFNLSHSGDLVLLAVSRDREVGVDVEAIRPAPELEGVTARFFTPDQRAWVEEAAGPERLRRFFRVWTCREALLKAVGRGFSAPRPEIRLEFDRGGGMVLEADGWTAREVAAPAWPDYVAAASGRGREWRVRLRRWPAGGGRYLSG